MVACFLERDYSDFLRRFSSAFLSGSRKEKRPGNLGTPAFCEVRLPVEQQWRDIVAKVRGLRWLPEPFQADRSAFSYMNVHVFM